MGASKLRRPAFHIAPLMPWLAQMRHSVLCLLATLVLGLGCARHPAAPGVVPDPLIMVRRQLTARYAENEAAFAARDPDRVMSLRHPAFHTITEDGTVSTREQMYERTRRFIARVERFDSQMETITGFTLAGDTAHAIVHQRTVRQQRFPDGSLHEVRTSVVQRESWVRTAQGWLMWRVDQIQPAETLVDGRPRQ